MKKNDDLLCFTQQRWKKTIRIMKLTVGLLLMTMITATAVNTYSQNARISLNVKDGTILDIFREIERNSEFGFFYKSEEMNLEKRQSIAVSGATIDDILKRVLDENYSYKILDKNIVVTKGSLEAIQQQTRKVSGKVTDASGGTLPGVSVVVKGTTIGIVTDSEGNYSLANIPESATLLFSFVGMKRQEVSVTGKTTINIILAEDAIGLEEVIAIGYGTMRKSDLTGSVTNVDVKRYTELPNVSVIQSMQGSVAGLNIGAVNQAGQDPTISIRGQNTLSSTADANAPLIVVDGTIYRGSLIDLNNSDIESVDILKDASSAAIYGSQASNGVMLITTKKGKTMTKPIINYSGSYSVQVPSNKLKPMQSAEYTEFYPDIYWENGSRLSPDYLQPNPTFSIAQHLKNNNIINGFNNGVDNNWWGLFTGNGYINNHNLSLRGKSNELDYFISGGFTDVKGFVKNDTYKKYNYRINLNAKINDWMKVGVESFLTSSDYSGVSPDIAELFKLQPWAPIYDENNEIIKTPSIGLNPFLIIQQDDSDRRLNIFGNIHADIKLPLKGLSYKINFSQNYRTTNQDNFNPWGATYTGSGYKNSYINYDWTVDNIITYNNTFNEVHNVNATLVYGVEKRDYSFTQTGAQNFVNDLLGYYSLEAGNPTLRSLNTGKQQEQSLYSMGRVMYNYKNRYLLTGTVRRDGFSGFGTTKKIGVFPSVALGWVMSEERFIKDKASWLNYLKLRGSYGQTGRRGIGAYDTRAVVKSMPI